MTPGLNRVMLIGDLSRDPELRHTPEGTPVTTFNVGTSQRWLTADHEVRYAEEWFTVVAWGEVAERVTHELAQGDRVYVEGRLQTRSWEDSAGRRNFMAEVVAAEVLLLSRRGAHTTKSEVPGWPDEPPITRTPEGEGQWP